MPSFKKAKNIAEQSPASPSPAPKKRLGRNLLIAALSLLLGAGSALYVSGASDDLLARITRPEATSPSEDPPKPIAPRFVQFAPFTTSLSDGRRLRHIHVELTAQVDDDASATLLRDFSPLVRDRVLRVLSEQNPHLVQTPEGRQHLVDTLLFELRAPISATSANVSQVLFTKFVVQ